jgi:DNA repair protein RadC
VLSNDIRKVITRKTLLTELARRDVRTLEQLAAMTVDELQSVPGIGAKTAPRIQASAQAYLTGACMVWHCSAVHS